MNTELEKWLQNTELDTEIRAELENIKNIRGFNKNKFLENSIKEYRYDLTNFLKYMKALKSGNLKQCIDEIDIIVHSCLLIFQ